MDEQKPRTEGDRPIDDESLPFPPPPSEAEEQEDPIDDASANSFPASDPPSFTGSIATKDLPRRD